MRFEAFSFGSIRIDGTTYEHDIVIDRGHLRKRKKKPSTKFRDAFGHTPVSLGRDSMEVQPARGRHRDWSIAGHIPGSN